MESQELIQTVLTREFTRAKERNPAFSQRAFAKRVGLSSGAMSSLMSGQRRISKKLAKRLLDNLALNPVEKSELLQSFEGEKKNGPEQVSVIKTLQPIERTKKEKRLSLDQFEILANPLHFNLLSLLEIPGYQRSPAKMARKLGKETREVRLALERLTRLGLVEKSSEGFLPTNEEIASPDEVASSGIKRHHIESMEEARDSLFRDPIDKRDFTSQTLAVNSKQLEQAKALIRTFGEQLAELLDQGPGEKEDVYKINIQFFPVTRN